MTNRNLLGLTVLCAFGVVCLAACQQAPVEEPSPAGPPFSPSIEVDDTLYLSGQVGLDPETREMASGIQAETKVTMENLKRELEAKGCGFSDVVASHVWMTDISQIGQMSETYRSFFEGDKLPSRTTVAISKLALEPPWKSPWSPCGERSSTSILKGPSPARRPTVPACWRAIASLCRARPGSSLGR